MKRNRSIRYPNGFKSKTFFRGTFLYDIHALTHSYMSHWPNSNQNFLRIMLPIRATTTINNNQQPSRKRLLNQMHIIANKIIKQLTQCEILHKYFNKLIFHYEAYWNFYAVASGKFEKNGNSALLVDFLSVRYLKLWTMYILTWNFRLAKSLEIVHLFRI